MKKNLLILIIGLFACISCKQRVYTMAEDGGVVVKCRILGMESNGENIDTIKSRLSQRLQHVDAGIIPSVKYNESDSTYSIELPGVIDSKVEFLFAHGEINISELFCRDEILKSADSKMLIDSIQNHYFFQELFQAFHSSCPLFIQIHKNDIPLIDSLLVANDSTITFPNNLKLAWGKSGQQIMDLYMLSEAKKMSINRIFTKSRVSQSEHMSNLEIWVSFNEEGAKQFAILTDENVDKQVAISIDNQVLSAPIVNSRIDGGRMSIVGDYSSQEIMFINSVLYTPIIKSDIQVLDIQMIDKPQK